MQHLVWYFIELPCLDDLAGTDAWSIHKGSCDYGYIWKNEPLGWDVAAMTDYHSDYPDSCG